MDDIHISNVEQDDFDIIEEHFEKQGIEVIDDRVISLDEINDIIHMKNGKDQINTICYIPLSVGGIESSDTIVGVTCVDCLQIMEIYSRNGINYERIHRFNETTFEEFIKG